MMMCIRIYRINFFGFLFCALLLLFIIDIYYYVFLCVCCCCMYDKGLKNLKKIEKNNFFIGNWKTEASHFFHFLFEEWKSDR